MPPRSGSTSRTRASLANGPVIVKPRVVHAGPGVPAAGSIHVPPSQAKKDEKKDEKKD